MTAEFVVTIVYGVVPIIAVVAWLPQVFRLVRKPSLAKGMSISTGLLWSFIGIVTVVYAVVVVKDLLLTIAASVDALGATIVFIFAVKAHRKTIK